MTAITFATLAYSNTLQATGMPREQAEAFAMANAEALRSMAATQELVTKQDFEIALTKTKADLEKSIAETKHELLKWLIGMMIARSALLAGIIAYLKVGAV